MFKSKSFLPYVLLGIAVLGSSPQTVLGQASGASEGLSSAETEAQAVSSVSRGLVNAFNQGDAKKLSSFFAPQAALTDDAGNEFRGLDEITDIFQKFIDQFPGAKMQLDIESIRLAGPEVAIEEGTRTVATQDGADTATNRYTMVYVKSDGDWRVASAREYAEDPVPTAHDQLQRLEWLVGDWVDEDAEAAIAISCRWTDDQNFLLADFRATVDGEVVMQSQQRIGWDPQAQKVRSWVFDSDGGFGEGRWTEVDGNWVIKSTAVLPDGQSGSATIFFESTGPDRFLMKGFDRVLADEMVPDFEAVIVRQPPEPSR